PRVLRVQGDYTDPEKTPESLAVDSGTLDVMDTYYGGLVDGSGGFRLEREGVVADLEDHVPEEDLEKAADVVMAAVSAEEPQDTTEVVRRIYDRASRHNELVGEVGEEERAQAAMKKGLAGVSGFDNGLKRQMARRLLEEVRVSEAMAGQGVRRRKGASRGGGGGVGGGRAQRSGGRAQTGGGRGMPEEEIAGVGEGGPLGYYVVIRQGECGVVVNKLGNRCKQAPFGGDGGEGTHKTAGRFCKKHRTYHVNYGGRCGVETGEESQGGGSGDEDVVESQGGGDDD
ncbi:hypothetical protein KIPB_011373, partial [Kipferlia bialata]